MENDCKKIFYIGIAYGEYPKKGQRPEKTGLPVRKLERDLPYLTGAGKRRFGKLRIYFSLLPEYAGKTFFHKRPRRWKEEKVRELIERTEEVSAGVLEWAEQIAPYGLDEDGIVLPTELWAACMYAQRPFENIGISFSKEAGEALGWQVIEMIAPYLPRIRQVFYQGDRNRAFEILEASLYEEYGIIMINDEKRNADALWLDFSGSGYGEADKSIAAGKYLSCPEILKFLDTSVKNSYNTEVN